MTDVTQPGDRPEDALPGDPDPSLGNQSLGNQGETALPGGPGEDAGLAAERERLARQLRDTRLQLAMTQSRLTALQGSAKMRFGTVLANAVHRPWPRGVQLPGELYKLWRDRGLKPSGAQNAATALATAQLTDLAGAGERFLSALTAPAALRLGDPALALSGLSAAGDAGARGLVIAGAISALGAATLAPDAIVHPLLPHDADVVLEGTGADMVLIEAAAMLPGNPWAYATDPAAADRGRRLARMIVMARSLGKPVVLVRNVPHSLMPGLSWLAPTVDAVVDGDLGVQFARFNPVGIDPARPSGPVYAGDRDPREAPGVRTLLDALTGNAVELTGARSWRGRPGLYRSHAVFVTASASQALEQRACGARVVSLAGQPGTAADGVRGQLDAARAGGPLPLAEIRVALRDIFESHATPARLAAFARAADLPAGLVGGRQVAVLARADDDAAAGRLADSLARQRLRPAEVIVAAAPDTARSVTAALCGLADQGIRVMVDEGGAEGSFGQKEWAGRLARLANSPWAAPWPSYVGGDRGGCPPREAAGPAEPPQSATYLLDLACARECAQADAVGFGDGEYEFTRSLRAPALVRRDLFSPGAPSADGWGSHGLRLFSVTRVSGTRDSVTRDSVTRA